ncbi:hypothetical protein [Corynebacterium bovis]|nr:hypothetical protein [Corynebacterium bovis]
MRSVRGVAVWSMTEIRATSPSRWSIPSASVTTSGSPARHARILR